MNKAQRRLIDYKTDVYRAYDRYDVLLYVGTSVNVFTRLRQHRYEHARWVDYAELVEVETYADRRQATYIEALAIQDEFPMYNVQPEKRPLYNAPEVMPEPVNTFRMWQDENNKWWVDEPAESYV